MKKIILLSLSLTILISCKNDRIEKLEQENIDLQRQLMEKNKVINQYAVTIIHLKMGNTLEGTDSGMELRNIKNKIFCSEIKEIQNFDQSIKFWLQDQLEKELRRLHSGFIQSIQKRETFIFDTYAEASEFRFKTINE